MKVAEKQVVWIGSALADLRKFPAEAQKMIGTALHWAQVGTKHPDAKPMKGFTGAGVLEIVEHHDGDTYRAVYAVRLGDVLYVLHAFQKKSKRGIATPKRDVDLIRSRLQDAKARHAGSRP